MTVQDRAPLERSPRARLGALVHAEFLQVLREVHRENNDVPESRVDAVTETLMRAIVEPTQHFDVGLYLFFVVNHIFRYAYDGAQGVYIMYRYDGARWSSCGARENFECESQEFLVDILQRVYLGWTEYVKDDAPSRWLREYCKFADVIMADATSEQRKHARVVVDEEVREYEKVKELYHQITREGGVHHTLRSCERRMKSSVSCESHGIPSPIAFFESLDEHDFLIGFDNGVYNLNESRFYERHSVPRSYAVSMSVGYDFEELNDDMRDRILEIDNFVYARIFPDASTRKQIQAVVGSLLSVGNPIKKIVLLLGQGDNGKSAFVSRLLKLTLGDYFGVVPVQVLTERREGADSCNPSLSANRKRRCIALNEGEKRMRLNGGVTKSLTGNDDIHFRNLYKQPVSARFHATMLYLSNVAPELESGEALRDRAYPIDCVSKFDSNVDRDDPENRVYRRLTDTDFTFRCRRWKMAHMHMAITWWRDLRLRNFSMPPVPKSSVAERMVAESSDDGLFASWLRDHFVPVKMPASRFVNIVQVRDIKTEYNAQVEKLVQRFISENDCKRSIRRCSALVVKDQQRVGKQNVRNFVFARRVVPSDAVPRTSTNLVTGTLEAIEAPDTAVRASSNCSETLAEESSAEKGETDTRRSEVSLMCNHGYEAAHEAVADSERDLRESAEASSALRIDSRTVTDPRDADNR
ncbi:hypothetical protein CYMTET_36933 [Cymbomonas tetramitiformis]|uniref:SF3 helicase domain-containing protein n=1 Tax=Cymbomonas tetramitiformis TaxID=36881 RepID=A0AAE0CF16_9CHLO|nr:hypothetical protein CYMTET_36933 [Cymbomonas tetramitiformis]